MGRIVKAGESGETLAEDASYRTSLGKLPGKAGGRVFVRMEGVLAGARRELGPLAGMLDAPGFDLARLAGGAVVTMDDGIVEARMLSAADD